MCFQAGEVLGGRKGTYWVWGTGLSENLWYNFEVVRMGYNPEWAVPSSSTIFRLTFKIYPSVIIECKTGGRTSTCWCQLKKSSLCVQLLLSDCGPWSWRQVVLEGGWLSGMRTKEKLPCEQEVLDSFPIWRREAKLHHLWPYMSPGLSPYAPFLL